jgi:hypothetical protein
MQFLGNKQYEKKLKEKAILLVEREENQKKLEVEFLEAMIKELEE